MRLGNDTDVKRRCAGSTREAEALDDLAYARMRFSREMDVALGDVEAGRLDPTLLAGAVDAARVVFEAQVMHKPPHRALPRALSI